MNDDDRHELGRLAEAALPDPPAVPDRAASALGLARRNRRRRTGLVAVSAAAAVVALTVGVSALGSSTPQATPSAPTSAPTSRPTSTPTPAADPVTDVPCPRPMRRGDPYPDPTDDRPLPTGAVVARLCPISVADFGGFAAPADALVTDTDRLVEAITALPRIRRDAVCTTERAVSWWIAFAYPDGSERLVQGSNAGCETLAGAGPERRDSEQVWDLYLRLLREQRRALTPPGAAPVACPGDDLVSSPVGEPLELEHAVLRWRRTDTESEPAWACASVPDDDLRRILRDLATSDPVEVNEEDCVQATLQLDLLGRTAWNDVTSIAGDCGAWYLDDRYRRLPADTQAVVDRIVEDGGTAPLPEATPDLGPDEIVTLFVDLVNDGRLDEARALTSDPSLADVTGRLDVKVEDIINPAGSGQAVVNTIYRETIRLQYVDYREAQWRLRREPGGVWTIVSMTVGDVVPTGR